MLSGQCIAPEARNRELVREVKQLRAERRHPRSPVDALNNVPPLHASRPARARTFIDGEERRRPKHELHDGVQDELLALIVKLTLAEQDPDTSACLAGMVSALGASGDHPFAFGRGPCC